VTGDSDDAFDKTADAGIQTGGRVALAPGRLLGKYRLDRILGEGGMGVVWAAQDPDLERSVALKVLRYAQATPQLRQRLLREARAMAKLKHPNVLTVYEVGTVEDRDYIAMELVEGTSLDRWLAANPPQEEVWSAILAAGRGLAAAHDAGVVHRDFKPHNVLRSREGRILVTDFGLARGLLGEEDSAAIDARIDPAITPFDKTLEAPRKSDAVLDTPLTLTGALIGTPAYMAPEQYRGAAPDPRTDQFAFCVTAWQALTGDRPFKGASLDEMRKAASTGVAHIPAKLPRGVRAVLERGLDPDPEKRWRSLEDLLDALERAGKAPARRRRIAISAGAVGLSALIVSAQLVMNRPEEKPRIGCDNAELEFAEAWSPAVRSELARKGSPAFGRIAEAFDQFKDRWVASYEKACRARNAPLFRDRIACLEGLRDQISSFTYLLRETDVRALEAFEPHGVLPNVTLCEGPAPTAPAPLPREPAQRARVLKTLGRSFALRGAPPAELDKTVDALIADAKATGYAPLVPAVLVVAGNEYLRHGNYARARQLFNDALKSFPKNERHDASLEANAWLGQLEASMRELEKPGAHTPPGIEDPNAKPVLHPELTRLLAAASGSIGNNAMLAGARAELAAEIYAELAQYNRYKHAYDDALQSAADARKHFESIGDVRRAASTSRLEAVIYMTRGDERALDDASFAARRATDALDSAKLPPLEGIDDVAALVAFARGSYTEAHRIYDRLLPKYSAHGAGTITGRVHGATGMITVVAWRGELVGDPRRLYTQPNFVGDVASVEHDGTFTIHAQPGWAIMAEGTGVRSTPQIIGATPLALELKPVTTVSGTVKGKNLFGVQAYARYSVGASRWVMQVPVRDASFDLRGLPPGSHVLGLTGQAGTANRTTISGTVDAVWPYGQAIEIVVRAKEFDDGAHAWLIRGKKAIATRADLDPIAASAIDVATSSLVPIGADNTDAGREVYRAGDRHAVITGNFDEEYIACAAATQTGKLVCKPLVVKHTVAIEYSDGRFGGGVTPIVIEL